MEQLAGRIAFITGGAQGIGLGIARAFAKEGVRLALADINTAALQEAQSELSPLTETRIYPLDVRDREQYASVADAVEHDLGPVTLLFNNAGVTDRARATELTYEAWDWGLGINLQGVINGIQTFLPRMLERGGDAHIVNTASGAGLVMIGASVPYSTAKFAVVGLSESLRFGVRKHNIGVSVLCPGYVTTNILSNSAALEAPAAATPAGGAERLKKIEANFAGGSSIDEIGSMVLAGVKANQLHIYTDDMTEHIERRSQALMDARPTKTSGQPVAAGEVGAT